jgi:acyl carrier protein
MNSVSKVNELLAEIFSSVLGKPVGVGDNLLRSEEERWDSLKHMEIIIAAEAAFGVHLTNEEIAEVASVSDLRTLITGRHAT